MIKIVSSKHIKELENRVERSEELFKTAYRDLLTLRQQVLDESKHSFAWEVQEHEADLVRDGKKYRRILKVIK